MEILSTAETGYAAEEDELLNFSLDAYEQPEDLEAILKGGTAAASFSSFSTDGTTPFRREIRSGSPRLEDSGGDSGVVIRVDSDELLSSQRCRLVVLYSRDTGLFPDGFAPSVWGFGSEQWGVFLGITVKEFYWTPPCSDWRSIVVHNEFVEEELEWLSNKDAFPAVETWFGILSDNPELMVNHQSPVSVLENSSGSSNSNGNGSTTVANCCRSLKVPSRPRSSSTRRRRATGSSEWASKQCLWLSQVNKIKSEKESCITTTTTTTTGSGGVSMGRRCLHCQAEKTPQWRAGPMGPKTLCNACGVRFKSGRLLPEYRPANSPTFSTTLHSNSHRKVVEMRKHKQLGDGYGGGVMVNEGCGYMGRIDK